MMLVEDKVYAITEITREIKESLEDNFSGLWVEGEISNFTRARSGHLYYSLKDAKASLRCVMWRNTAARLKFEPEDGMKVRAFGDITVYEPQGAYQLRTQQLLPLGIGELEIAFQQLKEKLYAEGLFDPEHKQELPEIPQTVAVITSPTGAAVRDIIVRLRRRWPPVRIVVLPTLVQGSTAGEQIAQAIDDCNQWGEADVIIVGRGGGSLEDLWAFNEEVVARAIFASRIPIVSAVGHEVDFTISDFVADVRAPTPTAAAEIIVPDAEEYRRRLANMVQSLVFRVRSQAQRYREIIVGFGSRYGIRRVRDLIYQHGQLLDDLTQNLSTAAQLVLERRRNTLNQLHRTLMAVSPQAVLNRGYSITRTLPDRSIIRNIAQVAPGTTLETVVARGTIISDVTATEERPADDESHSGSR